VRHFIEAYNLFRRPGSAVRLGNVMRLSSIGRCCFVASILLGGATCAYAEKRIALVIGNSQYVNPIFQLNNPDNDAADVAGALKQVSVDVDLRLDLKKGDFDSELAAFERKAEDADVVIFYYAGHGVQYKGQNYLLPIDSVPKDNHDIRFQTIGMDEVISAIDSAPSNSVKIVILDACRNTVPDSGKSQTRSVSGIGDASGLARIDSSDGMIVFYSTSPGHEARDGGGRNSPFAESLAKRITEPHVEIQQLFSEVASDVKQVTNGEQHPETVSSELTIQFFLNPGESDSIAWDRIHTSRDPALFREFMRRFPASPRYEDAQDKLDLLDRIRRDDEAKKEEERLRLLKAANDAELLKLETARKEQEEARLEDRLHLARERAAQQATAEFLMAKRAEAERARLAQIETDKQATAERERLAQIEAEKRAAEEARLAQMAAEQARLAQAEADKQVRAKWADDAAKHEGERRAAEQALREASEKKGAEEWTWVMALEEKAKIRLDDAVQERRISEACGRDQAVLAQLEASTQTEAIGALGRQSGCPTLAGAAQGALDNIARLQTKECDADRKMFATLDRRNETVLRGAMGTMKCAAVLGDAAAELAKLEDERQRQEQICLSERSQILSIDLSGANARQQLTTMLSSAACSALRDEISAHIKNIDNQASVAQVELRRLGCYSGAPSGKMDDGTIAALTKYLTARHATEPEAPRITDSLIDELQDQDEAICLPPSARPMARMPAEPRQQRRVTHDVAGSTSSSKEKEPSGGPEILHSHREAAKPEPGSTPAVHGPSVQLIDGM
jgi:Caspase domain